MNNKKLFQQISESLFKISFTLHLLHFQISEYIFIVVEKITPFWIGRIFFLEIMWITKFVNEHLVYNLLNVHKLHATSNHYERYQLLDSSCGNSKWISPEICLDDTGATAPELSIVPNFSVRKNSSSVEADDAQSLSLLHLNSLSLYNFK